MKKLKILFVTLFATFLWHAQPAEAETVICDPIMVEIGLCPIAGEEVFCDPRMVELRLCRGGSRTEPPPPPPPVITYTFWGLKSLITSSEIKVDGVKASLLAQVDGAEKKHFADKTKTAKNKLKATHNHVKAQSGINIDRETARRINAYIRSLSDRL